MNKLLKRVWHKKFKPVKTYIIDARTYLTDYTDHPRNPELEKKLMEARN